MFTLFVLAQPSHPCGQLISQPPQWKCLKYTLKCSNTLPLVLPRLRPRSETRAWNSYSNASRGRVRLVRTSAHSSSVVCIRLGSCVLWNCVKVALASLGAEVITLSLLHCQTDKTGQVQGSNLPLKPVEMCHFYHKVFVLFLLFCLLQICVMTRSNITLCHNHT